MADLPGPSSAPNSPELPVPSTPPVSLSKSEENFCRLCLLIMTVCSDLFRDILSRRIQPGYLRGELDKNKNILQKYLKIPKYKQLLYPPSGGQSVSAKDMDLSLLYTLLRNICGIPRHQAGWGNTPNLGDNSLAACIERIREQKNAIASHSTAGEVNDTHFQDIWNSLQTDIMNIEKILTGGDMYERTVNRLLSCDLSPPTAKEHIEKFKRLYDKIEEAQSQTRHKIEEAQSQTRHFHSWKKARINNLTMRQSAIKRKLIGVSASKKARIGRLEKQQSSATSDIKETLKETEEHILFMVQGRLSGNEERIKEMLKETEKNIFSMIQEKIMDAEEYILDTMQKKLLDTEKRTLNKMQEKLLETEERTLNTMHEKLLDTEERTLNTMQEKLLETEERTLNTMQEKLLETEERTLNTMQEKLKTTEKHILNRVQGRLSGIEDQIKGRLSGIEDQIKDMKARDFSLVRTFTINLPHMSAIHHISLVTSDRLWVDGSGTLKQVDATGNVIKTLDDKYNYYSNYGAHAVSGDGDLVFIAEDRDSEPSTTSGSRSGVYKMTSDGNITTLFTTDKYPACLYCSHINGDILIGMRDGADWDSNALVLRCDNTGRKIQDIELDDAGKRLYRTPDYITENRINGDILVSGEHALVVVDRSGQHRFDYTGRSTESDFYPQAVCTDLLGRILVVHNNYDELDGYKNVGCISLLNKDGHFLTRLLTDEDDDITSLCVDDNHNIYVGNGDKIKVYK